jgi:hypothetical protein
MTRAKNKKQNNKPHKKPDTFALAQGRDRSGAEYAVAIVFMLLAFGGFMFSLRRIGIAVTSGENCAGRHCSYWATQPWGFSLEIFGHCMILLVMGGLMAGCFSIFSTRRDGSPN